MGARGGLKMHNYKKHEAKDMVVKVLFFGVLTEVTGTICKHYREVKSIGDLKLRIQDDFPEIVHYNFRVSLNNKIINDDPKLIDGDEVALMPPFAGG
jgi:molybdopterin converting factor small subunit